MVDEAVDGVFEDQWTRDLNKKTLKQVFGRSFISGREAQTLIGLFRKVGGRLKKR
jgi:tRNA C32,U32 (ribose-2'-O)-methylase TrmJ